MSMLRAEAELAAEYPGTIHDKLFEAIYHHISDNISCKKCNYNEPLVTRRHLEQAGPTPTIHFGLIMLREIGRAHV